MNVQHSKEEIQSYLKKESIGILGTIDHSSEYVRQRVMYYGIDKAFNCYLMSTKASPKIDQILSTHFVSFIVFGMEDPYDNSWEAEIDGKGELIQNEKDIQIALNYLKERNPFADVAIESGITGQFDFIKLIPRVIRFRIYGEALKGDKATVIEKTHEK